MLAEKSNVPTNDEAIQLVPRMTVPMIPPQRYPRYFNARINATDTGAHDSEIQNDSVPIQSATRDVRNRFKTKRQRFYPSAMRSVVCFVFVKESIVQKWNVQRSWQREKTGLTSFPISKSMVKKRKIKFRAQLVLFLFYLISLMSFLTLVVIISLFS